jgi:hypothetical protein
MTDLNLNLIKEYLINKEKTKLSNTKNPGGLNGIDKIIIINLKGSIREHFMREQLKKIPNLIETEDYEFVNPINFIIDDFDIEELFKQNIFSKSNLDEHWIDIKTGIKHNFFKNEKDELNKGTISLSLITYYLYLRAYLENKIFLILEDNVELLNNFVSNYNLFYSSLPQNNWISLDLHTTNNYGYKPEYKDYYEKIKNKIDKDFDIPIYNGTNQWRPRLRKSVLLGTCEAGGAKAYIIKPISFLFINSLPIIYSADYLKGTISTIENGGITFVSNIKLINYTDKYSNDRRNIDSGIITNNYVKLEKKYIDDIINTVKNFDYYQNLEFKKISFQIENNKYDIIKNNFIGIGINCFYAKYKKDYFQKLNIENGITNFFDWIDIKPNDIIKIINSNNIENDLYIDNWNINYKNNIATLKNNKYSFISYHDLNFKNVEKDNYNLHIQINLIEKYIRRHNRLIEKLKNNDKILFIHTGNHEEFLNHIEFFMESIKKINDKKYIIVLLNSDKDNKYEKYYYKYNDNIYILNMINISIIEDGYDLRHCTKINKYLFFDLLFEIYFK